jgi:hypothetical protein
MLLWLLGTIRNLPKRMFGIADYLVDLIYGFDHRLIGPFLTIHLERKACHSSLQSGSYARKRPYDLTDRTANYTVQKQ